jgi:hypothetical protein
MPPHKQLPFSMSGLPTMTPLNVGFRDCAE